MCVCICWLDHSRVDIQKNFTDKQVTQRLKCLWATKMFTERDHSSLDSCFVGDETVTFELSESGWGKREHMT